MADAQIICISGFWLSLVMAYVVDRVIHVIKCKSKGIKPKEWRITIE